MSSTYKGSSCRVSIRILLTPLTTAASHSSSTFTSRPTMQKLLGSVLCAILLSASGRGAPASVASTNGTASASAAEASATVAYASDNANRLAWNPDVEYAPAPVRDTLGASILGPQNVPLDQQNPDLLAPPTTDAGTVYASPLPFFARPC